MKDKENEDESFRGNDFPILVKAGMAQAMAIQLKPDPHKPGGKVSGFIQIG